MLLDPRGRGRCGRGRRITRPRQHHDMRETEASNSNHSQQHHNSNNHNANSSENNRSANENGSADSQTPDSSRSTRSSLNATRTTTLPDNFNRFRMGSINWGLWGCFIIVTILLVPAHIYLKRYDYRGELMGIFFVITLLFLVCFSVSMFHTKTRAILLHRLHLEDDIRQCPMDLEGTSPNSRRRHHVFGSSVRNQNRLIRHLALRPIRVSRSTPDLLVNGQVVSGSRVVQGPSPQQVSRSLSQVSHNSIFNGHMSDSRSDSSPIIDHSEDPPPYHEAIMLPAPSDNALNRHCETPPPAYEIVQ